MSPLIIPTKENLAKIIDGIIDQILESMDRDTEAELPWEDFLEFMDKATDEHRRLFNFLQHGEHDYDQRHLM